MTVKKETSGREETQLSSPRRRLPVARGLNLLLVYVVTRIIPTGIPTPAVIGTHFRKRYTRLSMRVITQAVLCLCQQLAFGTCFAP